MRMVLASADEKTDLAKLTDMADKIIEVAPSVSAISRTTSDAEIEKLQAEVTCLADLINSLTQQRPRRDRSESRGRRPRSPARSPAPTLTLHNSRSAGTIKNLVKPPRSARSWGNA